MAKAALAAASDAPGYPFTAGTTTVREAAARWLARALHSDVSPEAVLPVIGTKELVAWLPTMLEARTVGLPSIAYPTYEVGALLAGAKPVCGGVGDLTWVNSPSNPTGAVMSVEELREVVRSARERGGVIASDECYSAFGWDAEPVSILDPRVSEGDHTGLLAVHSLSKRSNLAGYRAGFVAGDAVLVRRLLEVRKHAGMIVPAPVQAAMAAALDDDAHVEVQRNRYLARRRQLRPALEAAGFRVEHSEAGLYLWATREEDCWTSVAWLADRGILVAPGEFYGAAGARHVRVALTATDERIESATNRLTSV
ncbi:MAG: hypothetical protein QOE64_1489 [Frankiales bacterium]|nr:hypothetical protein [Frankiales bacterium]